jgi:hypothetical protein
MPAPANPIAQSSKRRISVKKESVLGVAAGATDGYVARRTNIGLVYNKAEVNSNEKRDDFQESDVRHGTIQVTGPIDQELIPGDLVQKLFTAAMLRRDFTNAPAVTSDTGDGFTIATNVIARAGADSFIDDDGFRVGMVVRLTNFSVAGNNNRNCLITALTDSTMTLAALDSAAGTLTDNTSDEDATITAVGQYTFVPSTNHTSDSFNVEDYNGDLDKAKLWLGCRIVGASFNIAPNGMIMVSWRIMGLDQEIYETSSAPYFTGPASAGDGEPLEPSLGHIRIRGTRVARVTGFTIEFDLGAATIPVNGSPVSPDVFYGQKLRANGQITVMIEDLSYLTAFKDETEGELFLLAAAPGSQPRAFRSFFMGRTKFMSVSEDDPDSAIIQTLNYRVLKKKTATGYESTMIMVQDSEFEA